MFTDGDIQLIDWEFSGFNLEVMEVAIYLDDFQGIGRTIGNLEC